MLTRLYGRTGAFAAAGHAAVEHAEVRPANDPHDLQVGAVIASRYRILAEWGKGGMAVTYRCWDHESGRPVVLKRPSAVTFKSAGAAAMFDREARLMAFLSHPHIMPLTAFGEQEGIPFIVMPFLPGGALLHRRLRDADGSPLPMHPGTLHLWLPQVADALDYMHRCGVVHGDVKPANVLFDGGWHAFLTDFGVARYIDNEDGALHESAPTPSIGIVGTPEYMAPEAIDAESVLDGRSDQYALAVMVYEVLVGERVFAESRSVAITRPGAVRERLSEDHLAGVPSSLADAVFRALETQPQDRFESCAAFSAAVIAEIPAMQDEPGIARLLCPSCENILKLPATIAGRNGRCSYCKAKMMVAQDMAALWLLTEDIGPVPPVGQRRKAGRRQRPSRRKRWWAWPVTTAAVVLLLVGAGFTVSAIHLVRQRDAARNQSEALRKQISDADAARRELVENNDRLVGDNASLQQKNERLFVNRAQGENNPPDLQKERLPQERLRVAPDWGDDQRPAAAGIQEAPDTIQNSIGITLRLCAPGTFVMGNKGRFVDHRRQVTVSKAFYIGLHEVTNANWKQVMGTMPSRWQDDDFPVDTVKWQEAVDFCRRLSALPDEQARRRVYRLPTEAEWEYSCRAGTSGRFSFDDEEDHLREYAWFMDNAQGQSHPVGVKLPNAWGLFDMHGNVMEWCGDHDRSHIHDDFNGGVRSAHGVDRVCRGGWWAAPPSTCGSADRLLCDLSSAGDGATGFRVVLSESDEIP